MSLPDWLPKPLRKLINILDDPLDNFKHWWRGYHVIFGKTYYFDCYMSNVPNSKWKIERTKYHD